MNGQPTIRVDYLAKLNEMVRPVADESLNAGPHYLKAIELYVPDKDFEAGTFDDKKGPGLMLTPERRLALNEWLNKNGPAIAELRLGTAKPYCWFEYSTGADTEWPTLLNVLLPHIHKLEYISLAICLRMQLAVEDGNWDAVAVDLKTAKTLGRHFMGCATLVEQLRGLRIDRKANEQLIHVLRRHYPSEETLKRLATSLAESFPSEYPIVNMDFEALMHLDVIQRLFTDNGSGDGHMIPGQLGNVMHVASGEKEEHSQTERLKFVAGSMIHSSRRRTLELFEQWKQRADQHRSSTPYQNYITGYSLEDWALPTLRLNLRNFLPGMLTPSVDKAVWISYIGRAHHDAAQTVVALLRYKAEHGQFPQTLDELVPQYLKVIPDDPFGPGPLTYKRQGDDFILYSWGLNFEDHGGQHNKETFRQKAESGDYVFWPPEPVKRPD